MKLLVDFRIQESAHSFVNAIRASNRTTAGAQILSLIALRQLAKGSDLDKLWQMVRNHAVHYGRDVILKEALLDVARRVETRYPTMTGLFTDTLIGEILQSGGEFPEFFIVAQGIGERFNADSAASFGRWFDAALEGVTHGANATELTTPRLLSRLMVRLASISLDMSVLDPCCGFGAILSEAIATEASVSLYGQEINSVASALTKLRLYFLGNRADIEVGDALRAPAWSYTNRKKTFDRVICDPPLGFSLSGNIDDMIYQRFGKFSSNRPEALYIEHCLQCLKPSGTGVILVPYSFLVRRSEAKIREQLVRRCVVEGVITLPTGAIPWNEMQFALIVLRGENPIAKVNQIKLLNSTFPPRESKKTLDRLSDEKIDAITKDYRSNVNDGCTQVLLSLDDIASSEFILEPAKYLKNFEDKQVDLLVARKTAVNAEISAIETSRAIDTLIEKLLK